MADQTLRSLAEEMRIEPDDLICRLSRLGIRRSIDAPLSGAERDRLLACLGARPSGEQLVLRRKTYGVLNLPGIDGKERTVEVEVRRRCVCSSGLRSAAVESSGGEVRRGESTLPRLEGGGQAAEIISPARGSDEDSAAVDLSGESGRQPVGLDVPMFLEERGGELGETIVRRVKIDRRAREMESTRSRAKVRRRMARSAGEPEEESPRDEVRSGVPDDSHLGTDRPPKRADVTRRATRPGEVVSSRRVTGQVAQPAVVVEEMNSLEVLADRMSVDCSSIVESLLHLGLEAPDDRVLDRQAARLVVERMGYRAISSPGDERERLILSRRSAWGVRPRPPVVVVVGHVDHGKTSLLDRIRSSRIVSTEIGGITQRIGAYRVETTRGMMTFLDTPGHAAFAAVRARGVQLTDIVLLVVAADDGVMPQTVEAIRQARSAKLPLVVAINKIDKGGSNLDRIRYELSRHGVIPEEWRGESQFVRVSAKLGTGITDLLEAISLQAELLELRAPAEGMASGIVVESFLDRGRGPVSTVLISEGRLRRGEAVLCGSEFGRVRSLHDEWGGVLEEAGPSSPVELSGLSGISAVGDRLLVLGSEREAREVALLRRDRVRADRFSRQRRDGHPIPSESSREGRLDLVLKVDRWGSAEAIESVLGGLSSAGMTTPRIVSVGVGSVSESDVNLAVDHGAVILGFNVRVDGAARRAAEAGKLRLCCYSVIYDLARDVERLVAERGVSAEPGLEQISAEGSAEVRSVFSSPEFGVVAGCVVTSGVIRRSRRLRVLRNGQVRHEGTLDSLRRFKESVDEVGRGVECGVGIGGFADIRPGDVIETSAGGED